MLGVPPAVALLFCIAGEFNADAVVTAEVRGGEAPLVAGESSRAGVVGVLTPGVQLQLVDRELDLRLEYGLRIFDRQPNDSAPDGSSKLAPLYLNVASLTLAARPARTLAVTGNAGFSYGAADYTVLGPLLGPNQSALPSVVDFLSLTAGLGAKLALSREWTLATLLAFVHRRPIGAAANVPPVDTMVTGTTMAQVPFPRQTSITATPSLSNRLTREDDLILTTAVSYGTYSTGIDVLTVTPELGWQAHLTPRYDLHVAGGVTFPRLWGMFPTGPAPSVAAPVGDAEFGTRFFDQENVVLRGSVGARAEYFVDPVLGTTGPRGTVLMGLSLSLPSDWTMGLQGSFSTSLSSKPLSVVQPGGAPYDETSASVWLPIGHRLSQNLMAEFGGRWSDRGPHLAAPNFEFHQREIWIYVLLTATSRRVREVAVP